MITNMDFTGWLPFRPGRARHPAPRPKIVRATGAVDLITRRYVDGRTDAAVDAIVMYGPPVEMFICTHDVCCPAAGYELVEGPEERKVHAGRVEAMFRPPRRGQSLRGAA